MKIIQDCIEAMSNNQYTYYCEVSRDRSDVKAGVYKVVASNKYDSPWFPKLNGLTAVSDRVWKQGPKGGVKIIKDRSWPYPMGYITSDEKWMKKFAWVKLSAKSL